MDDYTKRIAEERADFQAGVSGKPRPASERLMQFFEYAHLPEHLQKVSRPFGELAKQMASELPENAEKTTALRKLLEAKDCAVRAVLYREDARGG